MSDKAMHILVFPLPAAGHMIPLLDFTRRLASAADITILVTPQNLPLLSPILSSYPHLQTLVLPFPPHPSIPPHVENLGDLPTRHLPAFIRALAGLYDPLLSWFRSHPSPPRVIISDMFLGWTHCLASQLFIKRIVFSPSGAMALSVMYSLWQDLPADRAALVSFDRVPNCPKYPWWQISPLYRSFVDGDPDGGFMKETFLGNAQSWGLVINSFEELEKPYLDHLRERIASDRLWAVGPLLPALEDQAGSTQRGGASSVPLDQLMTWLDTCQDNEVVYVCFGSRTVLTNDQMVRLALGLEKSGARFIWSVKGPTVGHLEETDGKILSELEDRVGERGLVIRGWAPQVAILSHPAIGAFLTHCGWNSLLEGLVAGVTMLTWAMTADQFVDATLLVDELKVAVRVCEGADALPDADELARKVAESVSEERMEMRERVMRLRKAAMEAVGEGGSSAKDLDRFVKHLAALHYSN